MRWIRTIPVGRARVSVLDLGEITLPLAPEMGFSAEELASAPELAAFGRQRLIPMQDVLIELPGATILVDAGSYDIAADSPYAVEGYTPPPGLLASLAELGVSPEAVDHLVVTHRHWDHFNAVGREGRRPTFPRARHYLGAADWEAVAPKLVAPDSREARHLGVVHAHGLLETVAGRRELVAGVTIEPALGETAGHQIVRLESEGEVFYAIGDMYHHPIEIPRPGRMVGWADPATNRASRARLTESALRERATLLASHIPSLGRLDLVDGAPCWTAVG